MIDTGLLDRVLAGDEGAYALLHRPKSTGSAQVEVFAGEFAEHERLAELSAHHGQVLALLPYRQITERGFACVDDGSPLLAMAVSERAAVPLDAMLDRLPDAPIELTGGHFDLDDDGYADLVRAVLANEIGHGVGANFVVKRSFLVDIADYSPATALTLFRRLVARELGAYWTFLVHTGTRTFVGASPERHVTLDRGRAVMNPISGTYRYPSTGPELDGVLRFLADPKEVDELHMVLDEELKMMARVCDTGGRVIGPFLKEMGSLAHTEYLIEGSTAMDAGDVLRETLLAPTVTGSPLESACEVISRYEPAGRGYYSGVVALLGHDPSGGRTIDSAILIRTADIDASGRVAIGVGATLVRHSDPASEVAETRVKAAGLLAALTGSPSPSVVASDGGALGTDRRVVDALARRNEPLARFWSEPVGRRARPRPGFAGRRVLVVDAEDTFTAMIDLQLRSLGLDVAVRRFDVEHTFDGADLVVLGPGPGDPRDRAHPKIAHLGDAVRRLLRDRQPFLAVCLSHQVLSDHLGLPLVRRDVPHQGVQLEIDLFGRGRHVGFYNTFASHHDDRPLSWAGDTVEVSRDPVTGQVHALRGPRFASTQFHPESILTRDGPDILADLVAPLVTAAVPR
ncbi:anthranilate synthase family protein [Saccharothrix sp. S26]|uniref:anthranilate synthase family protein n=1 Tax=Saccharothrix sp. S26 TaxID=2907215 RepID=UPI001F4847B3|nr:anthranilate synthase family protein [Saccharothrix sp. S26]MCE6996409.1 anthranilate synthase family protein [Saccharothrix sp. S26]